MKISCIGTPSEEQHDTWNCRINDAESEAVDFLDIDLDLIQDVTWNPEERQLGLVLKQRSDAQAQKGIALSRGDMKPNCHIEEKHLTCEWDTHHDE